jgi:hypothetical protein
MEMQSVWRSEPFRGRNTRTDSVHGERQVPQAPRSALEETAMVAVSVFTSPGPRALSHLEIDMARHYQPRQILRRTSNMILKQAFERFGGLSELAWESLSETQVEPIYDGWNKMPPAERNAISEVLADAHDMSQGDCPQILINLISTEAPHLCSDLAKLASPEDRALFARLKAPQAFEKAIAFASIELARNSSMWATRNGLPKEAVQITEAKISAFRSALSNYFVREQMRGESCAVDHYPQEDGSHVFCANLSDYIETPVVFDGNRLVRRAQQRAFEMVLLIDPNDGTISMAVAGGLKVEEAIYEIACAELVGLKLAASQPIRPAFDLRHFLEPGFGFTVHAGSGIASVTLTEADLDLPTGNALMLRRPARTPHWDLYRDLITILDRDAIQMDQVTIRGARIQFMFSDRALGRSKMVRLRRDASSHVGLRQVQRDRVEKVLRDSGVIHV